MNKIFIFQIVLANNVRPEAKLKDDIYPPQSSGQLLVSGANMFFSQANRVVQICYFTSQTTMIPV